VLKALTTRYGLKVEDLMKGKRVKDNEPRKVGMYLAKELCDLKLKEIAAQFGAGSYGAVGWACHGVASRMEADAKFRDHVNSIQRIYEQMT
jgi:chromosomal replication initiation ATPase DnaA